MDLFQRHQGALGIFEDETVQKVHMICGMRFDGDLFSDRSSDGSSFESEWIPEIGSMGTSVEKVTAVQNQEAPFWCKTCKWLFKNEGAHGLNKTSDGFSCGKCKSEITVMRSMAQHAFNMREKDKNKRWGSKGEGKDKAPITPAPQNESDVPLTPAPSGQPDPPLSWFPDLSDQMGTPEWYKDMHDAVCRKGKPYRELVDKFERFISLLNEEGMTRYSKDYTSLKHQNRELFKACEEAGSFAALEKLIMVIDLRGQFGGQAALWEVVTTSGCVLTEVPYGTSGLSLATFVCGLCQKGATPLVLIGDEPDLSVRRMMDLFSMLPMIGAEVCVDRSAQKDQDPEWLKEWQRTDCLPLNVVCNGIRWVADLMCQRVRDKDPYGVLPQWAFWIYSNYKTVQAALEGPARDLMPCEETRPALSWECSCQWHSTNAYVTKHRVYLPVHLMMSVISHVRIHLDDLKEEMLQMEALVAKEVMRQQLQQQQQELKRKAVEQEEEAKRPRVEVPVAQGAAPSTGSMPQLALSEEDFRRIAMMVTQNILQAMPMLGQPPPGPPPMPTPEVPGEVPVRTPEGDQAQVMTERVVELQGMQDAARVRREAQVAEGEKKAETPARRPEGI